MTTDIGILLAIAGGLALYFVAGEIAIRFLARLWLQWRAGRDGADQPLAAWGIERLRLRRAMNKRIADLAPLTTSRAQTNLLALDATTLEARRRRAADRQAQRKAAR